jgi:formate dehydrogenase
VQRILRLLKIAQRIRHPRTQPGLPQRFILDQMLRRSGNGSFRQLLRHPHGKPRAQVAPGTFLGRRPTTDDGLVQLAPPEFVEAANRLSSRFEEFRAANHSGKLRLISKRAHSTHNSWTQNIDALTNGEHNRSNYLYLSPQDGSRLGLAEGDVADIRSATSVIRLPVKLLPDLMPGTVAVPHGWGHQHARGLSVASQLAGANVNILASDGPENIEPLSGMAHLSGIEVEIRPAAGPVNSASWSGR